MSRRSSSVAYGCADTLTIDVLQGRFILKIVLVDPPTSSEQIYGDWDLSGLDTHCPPLGLLYIASYLRAHGHEPVVLDVAARRFSLGESVNRILSESPDVVGISAKTINIHNAFSIAAMLKGHHPHLPLVLGGAHVTAVPEETMKAFPAFDYAVIGEGEVTFLELLAELGDHGNPQETRGIAWKGQDGLPVVNRSRPSIEDIDTLPFPAWDLLPDFPHGYKHSALETKRLPAASIITSRGCPFGCSFCDRAVFGSTVRQHSAEYTVRMIRHLVEEYRVRDLMILDDNFILDRKKLFAVCDAIIDESLDLSWYCQGHARFMTEDRLRKIRAAGCWFIEMGIESGCDRILRSIKKNTTKDEIERAVKRARSAGLKVKGNFIFGLPGETRKSMEETIEFARSIDLSYFQQNFFTPWPGCEIARNPELRVSQKPEWGKMAHQRVTFVPEGLSREDLIAASKRAFRRFYMRPRIIIEILMGISSWRALKNLMTSLGVFVRTILRAA